MYRGQLPPPRAPRRRRAPDYLGEFLNAPVTVVHEVYVAETRFVGWLVGHERKSRLNGAFYLYT